MIVTGLLHLLLARDEKRSRQSKTLHLRTGIYQAASYGLLILFALQGSPWIYTLSLIPVALTMLGDIRLITLAREEDSKVLGVIDLLGMMVVWTFSRSV